MTMDALCSGNNPGGIPGGSTSPTIKFDMTKRDVHSGLANASSILILIPVVPTVLTKTRNYTHDLWDITELVKILLHSELPFPIPDHLG